MSGIYFPSMEMPTRCYNCKIDCGLVSHIVRNIHPFWRSKECPLIPVPDHGRLIDADKQEMQIEALIERHLHGYTKSTWDFVCELRDILKRAPTIIPADKEGAE